MLEIIMLVLLAKEIGKLAKSKGLKPGIWKFYLVMGWIFGELIGILLGLMIFAKDNLISIMLVGIAVAVSSYFIIKAYLQKLPNYIDEEDINNIGQQ